MKIAQIAPIVERVPPKKYGGTERVVWALTEELARRGHEVTLFASGDSLTSARLESVYPRGIREARLKDIYGVNNWKLLNIGVAYGKQHEFDVIHDHTAPLSLVAGNLATTPVVVTMHGAFTADNKRLFQTLRGPSVATISHAQLHGFADINHAGVVHNGLPMDEYPFGKDPEDYLLFVGRISMEKGTHHAIEAALESESRLIIAAKLDTNEQSYFDRYVAPHLSERIRWVGEVDTDERNQLMSKARALLHPVTWREPFGLTMIEAMACGCPVIGFRRGSIPEVVNDGLSGYVVDDVEEMTDAIENLGQIDRAATRRYSLSHFSAKEMADGYERIYRSLLNPTQSSPGAYQKFGIQPRQQRAPRW